MTTRGNTLFDRLKAGCPEEWRRYTEHDFVQQLAAGTLPEPAFRHYLIQDYLFLIQFARAHALAVYKSDTLADMRHASRGVRAILDTEMSLHVEYCAGWGITEDDIARTPEASACMAYTRYVLERGAAGDLLDLHTALAPCMLGYGEIGARLAADPATVREGNPYGAWIDMYAGDEYQEAVAAEIAFLDDLMARRGGPGRMELLSDTFEKATRLEIDFWQMGLDAAGG